MLAVNQRRPAVGSFAGLEQQRVAPLFGMAFAMAVAATWAAFGQLGAVRIAEWFIAFSMCLLAQQKLKDVESFSTMFLNYDLLARRWMPYAYLYPFAEGIAGFVMAAGALRWLSIKSDRKPDDGHVNAGRIPGQQES